MLIGKSWKIEADNLNVILLRLKTTKPKDGKPSTEVWKPAGYYSKPANALKALVNFGVKETELKDLQTIVTRIDELEKQIERAVAKGQVK